MSSLKADFIGLANNKGDITDVISFIGFDKDKFINNIKLDKKNKKIYCNCEIECDSIHINTDEYEFILDTTLILK